MIRAGRQPIVRMNVGDTVHVESLADRPRDPHRPSSRGRLERTGVAQNLIHQCRKSPTDQRPFRSEEMMR